MSKPIIEIQDMSKLYRLGTIGSSSLQELLGGWYGRLFKNQPHQQAVKAATDSGRAGPTPNTFWALKDISAQIHRGEIVGVIGRNGAGKSTLLKILSRITEPTLGQVTLRGKVGSLLEVGAGFHPELSGRENIFLNGAILGMKKADIARKFDAIAEFSEIGDFLDTPVKRYSSGMYVRLAFAVAAHLEPDVLIVDEVLAVGDAKFQKKCIDKMQQVATADGRTVLFVSHSMQSIRQFCPRCLLIDAGRLKGDGPTQEVISSYLARDGASALPDRWLPVSALRRMGNGEAHFSEIRYSSHADHVHGKAHAGGPLEFDCAIESTVAREAGSLAITISDRAGNKLINADTGVLGERVVLKKGRNEVTLRLSQLHLNPGLYNIGLWLARHEGDVSVRDIMDTLDSVFEIEVVSGVAEEARHGLNTDGIVPCDFRLVQVAA